MISTVTSQIPEPATTAILVGLIILMFIIAFKLMQMVMQTVLITVISALFYITLTILFDYPLEINNLLLFSFLGAFFYTTYTFLASAYSTASKILSIPYKILKTVIKTFEKLVKKIFGQTKKLAQLIPERRNSGETGEKEAKQDKSSTKDVVIDKVKQKSKDEDKKQD